MNLIVDAGNSLLKLAVFDKSKLIFLQTTDLSKFCDQVKATFQKYPGIRFAMVSSVGSLDKTALSVLSVFCRVFVLDHSYGTPFKNSYATPQTLGVDRIALATAAFYWSPNRNTLVLDAGTCLTYDMINDSGEYLGGAISPGLQMRYHALHQGTARLPLLEPSEFTDFIGNSTESGIHSGVVNGMVREMDGVIEQYASRFEHLTVILTGGDTQFLSKRLKNTIFAHSNFLLEGLNYLLEYNRR